MKYNYFFLFSMLFISYQSNALTEKSLFSDFNITINQHDTWIKDLNMHSNSLKPISYENISRYNISKKQIPLFKYFPKLQETMPHIAFCNLPTPVHPLNNLNAQLNMQIYMKRDDLTGMIDAQGKHLYGGNKPRKLEFELANALLHGATTIITFGSAGSNHAVATGEYCNVLGLNCICMLKPQANSFGVRKNLLMHLNNNVELHYYPTNDFRKVGTLCTWLDQKNTYGDYPYVITTGGSTPLGALGFVNAAFELKEQIDAGLMPEPDYIYVPCGSVGTIVGLLLGCKAAGIRSKIIGITVEPQESPDEFKNAIKKLFSETNQLVHTADESFPLYELNDEDILLELNFCGPHYAVFTQEGIDGMRLLKETENIQLDGTYTAKAFAGMLDHLQTDRSNKIILFWNTYCGLDFTERIKNLEYKNLPACFHDYFENDVQELGF
jgi:1-aminocyclopropane-1-carboxylate deaminase/D-cysteine desulfhydrase-like pyridoxal-dependent ACC family enzyme